MTFNTRMRNLAITGMVVGALAGCATTQAPATAARPAATQTAAAQRPQTPTERCLREQRTRVQNCIIESIVTTCRESNAFSEDAFYSCVSDGLVTPQTLTANPTKQYSITVSFGDEILSIRTGRAVAMDAARLEVAQIDERGVAMVYEIERIATAAPTERTRVELATVRFNFDGTSEGDLFKLRGLPVWNLRVESADGGRARVSFETTDPGVLVRPADAAPAAPAQKKK
jgi:hypothetical protein